MPAANYGWLKLSIAQVTIKGTRLALCSPYKNILVPIAICIPYCERWPFLRQKHVYQAFIIEVIVNILLMCKQGFIFEFPEKFVLVYRDYRAIDFGGILLFETKQLSCFNPLQQLCFIIWPNYPEGIYFAGFSQADCHYIIH